MLTREDVVEIAALDRRGWSVSAIARHTGRDRKTVRAWLRGERDREAQRQPGPLEPFRGYVEQRFRDDPHLDATVLLRELRPLGFERSYPTLTREVTVLVCPPRRAQRKGVVEAAIRYLQRSWWRSAEAGTPTAAQASLDRWCVEVADQRRRDGLTLAALAAAEPLLPLPPIAYPAELRIERIVSASALVAFDGNRYSVPPTLAGQTVAVLARLGEPTLRGVSAAGVLVATHRRLPVGAGQTARSGAHQVALEQAVLAAFTTRPPPPAGPQNASQRADPSPAKRKRPQRPATRPPAAPASGCEFS
jgi:hypothetical protein